MDDKEILEFLKNNPEFLNKFKKSDDKKKPTVKENLTVQTPTNANSGKVKAIMIVVGVVIMLICLGFSALMLSGVNQELENKKKALTEVSNNLDKKKLELDAAKKDALSRVSGLDTKRTDEDKAKAHEMLAKVFTFKSSKEYAKNRKEFIEKYKPSEKFLKEFYSDVKSYEHLGEDGKPVNDIDLKTYKSEFKKIEPLVINISNDKYTYFAEFIIDFSMEDGKIANKNATMAAIYTIDSDGKFSDVKIWGLKDMKGIIIHE